MCQLVVIGRNEEHIGPVHMQLFPWADISCLTVLVAIALDFVRSFFRIETNLGGSHDLTRAHALGINLHLKITKRIAS
jgi:hypothetical protein